MIITEEILGKYLTGKRHCYEGKFLPKHHRQKIPVQIVAFVVDIIIKLYIR